MAHNRAKITISDSRHRRQKGENIMSNNTFCPWDSSGKLIPGTTVRQWAEFIRANSNGGNVTINRVYYNLHSLLISPPDGVNLDATITAFDNGYYGTPGVLTK